MATQLAFLPQPSMPLDSRQRLLSKGVAALTEQELLTVLLGKVEVAECLWSMLDEYDRPFQSIRELTIEQLTSVRGIGPYKAATVMAAIELGRRSFNPVPNQSQVVDNPAIAAATLSDDLMWSPVEKFAVLLLDIKHRLIKKQVVTVGSATETIAHPRDIFKAAVDARATRIIVAHNHPSGEVSPSLEDIRLTQQLLAAADVMAIPILDHIILGNGNHCSVRQYDPSLWAKE